MEEKLNIKVKGMFCTGCETRIKNALLSLEGIFDVTASYNNGEVKVSYDKNLISPKDIEDKITDLDYEIVKENETKENNLTTLCVLIILIALYIIFNHLGLLKIFNIFPTIESTMSYGMIFIVGILTSVHCIAMCGGINLSQSIVSNKNGAKITISNLEYNLGRVVSYTVIGGIVGLIGSVITLNGIFRGIVAIIAGLAMIVMAINMLGIFPSLRKFNIKMPKGIINILNKSKKGKSSFYIGLINGFMPCGPLQAMQIYALSTGSFIGGAISMLLFGLGTFPLMFGFGLIAGKLNKKFAKQLLKISSIIIFILGISMLGNGLAMSGISMNVASNSYENMAEIFEDYQEITTYVDYGSYESITVKKDIPVKWHIIVPEGKLNGCNNEIIIPKYDISIKLNQGENIVEFTPNESGNIPYSCWMGMIKSNIKVID